MNNLTVIFDMDGVILDSEKVYQEIEREMYTELNIPVSSAEHMKYMGTAETHMWSSIREKYRIKQDLLSLVAEERRRFIKRLEQPGSIPMMNGFLKLVQELHSMKIPLWIASSSSSAIIEKVLLAKRLQSYFQGFVSGEDVKHSKPSPEIFLKTAKLAATSPENCLVIEDSPNGVRAAFEAGMRVVALRNPGTEAMEYPGADLIVKQLRELDAGKIIGLIRGIS